MADRDAGKKAWEILQGRLVARELNAAYGSDFDAVPSQREPADIVLVSPSGRFSPRDAQVVSIPIDFRFRDDKGTVRQIRNRLTDLLRVRGARHMLVGLTVSAKAEMYGAAHCLVEELANLIAANGNGRNFELRYADLLDRSVGLSEVFHTVLVSFHPEIIQEVEVDIPSGGAIPRDGRWIEEGVAKKLAKYGGEKAVCELMLIVGVAGFVDGEQVAAFQRAFAAAQLPFAEIWINTPFDGTRCLKARTIRS